MGCCPDLSAMCLRAVQKCCSLHQKGCERTDLHAQVGSRAAAVWVGRDATSVSGQEASPGCVMRLPRPGRHTTSC